jgi:hypothetical protein
LSTGKLTPLQERVLAAVAEIPGWSLSGGASLAGFHLAHRTTRDLDLFVRDARELEQDMIRAFEHRLTAAGFAASRQTTTAHFVRWLISTPEESTVLDLVAEPVPALEAVETRSFAGVTIAVDSAHEILTNKLCALLSRTELRDLVDVQALLGRGLSLSRALADAPKKDAGFSPLVLANVLATIDFAAANRRAQLPAADLAALRQFTHDLADRCVREAWNGAQA